MIKNLRNKIGAIFEKEFNEVPLMAFAPGRINIIGEHTDYNDGFVLPAAIDKGIIAAVARSDSYNSRIIALDAEESIQIDLNNLNPITNGGWKNYVLGVIAEIKKLRNALGNFNLVVGGNIPIGGGVSSSAALENSIGFALNNLFNLNLSRLDLIKISQRADHNFVGVKSGLMDHYASMFGEKNKALMLDCRNLTAIKFDILLNDYTFLLVNSNVSHSLASSEYNERRNTCEKIASLLGKKSLRDVTMEDLKNLKDVIKISEFEKCAFVINENARVHKASEFLASQDLESLGDLMYKSHEGLQHHYKVSCEELDFLVDLTRENTKILGARMMGGGFGGCTINLIHKDNLATFKEHTLQVFTDKFGHECLFYEGNINDGTRLIT